MPYPYLPTFKDKRYDIGFDKIAERPKLEGAVGRCIALWSYVDNELGGLFGILLKTDSDAAQRVFLVLRRWSHQRDALKAAAEGTLSGDEMATFEALMVEYRSLESQRNDLSHGCFGICPDDDDLLFMIKVEHHIIWQADVLPKLVAGTTGPDSHQGLKEKLMVYHWYLMNIFQEAITKFRSRLAWIYGTYFTPKEQDGLRLSLEPRPRRYQAEVWLGLLACSMIGATLTEFYLFSVRN
jgi:hypothetical protein